MIDLRLSSDSPGLLVSVRNEAEARTALAAGADVVDVKEPDRGSLGAADMRTIAAIVQAVGGRAPVTAAVGELRDLAADDECAKLGTMPVGVSLFKVGLAGCGRVPDWQTRWRDVIESVRFPSADGLPRPVAVVYADWHTAGAPAPREVLQSAIELRCPALLVDTWDKLAGDLFDHWPEDELQKFLDHVRAEQLVAVLAGSLVGESFARAVRMSPNLVAVRSAACVGGRGGVVSADRVRDLKRVIADHRTTGAARRAFA